MWWQAPSDAYHSVIQWSLTVTVARVSTDIFWNTRIVSRNKMKHTNSARKFLEVLANFQKISRMKNNSSRIPGVSHTLWQNALQQSQHSCLPGALSTSGLVLTKAGIAWWSLFWRVSTSSRNACCTHSANTFWASTLSATMSTSQLKKCSSSDELAIHTARASASPFPFCSTQTVYHYHIIISIIIMNKNSI